MKRNTEKLTLEQQYELDKRLKLEEKKQKRSEKMKEDLIDSFKNNQNKFDISAGIFDLVSYDNSLIRSRILLASIAILTSLIGKVSKINKKIEEKLLPLQQNLYVKAYQHFNEKVVDKIIDGTLKDINPLVLSKVLLTSLKPKMLIPETGQNTGADEKIVNDTKSNILLKVLGVTTLPLLVVANLLTELTNNSPKIEKVVTPLMRIIKKAAIKIANEDSKNKEISR